MMSANHTLEAVAVIREVRADGFAWVEAEHAGCGRCDQPGGCGGNKTQLFCTKPRRFQVRNDISAPVGARVRLHGSPGSVARAVRLTYVWPLLGIVAGGVAGRALFPGGELGAILGACLGALVGWCYLKIRTAALDTRLLPRVVEWVGPAGDGRGV